MAKFKSADGRAFDHILKAKHYFCVGKNSKIKFECNKCPIYKRSQEYPCGPWVNQNPIEAALLMGYEIVEDDPTVSVTEGIQRMSDAARESAKIIQNYLNKWEDSNMDKPLKDWTLGECKKYCENRKALEDMCGGCKIRGWCDAITNEDKVTPEEWEFPPKYTTEEIETAQSLVNIWPDLKLYRHGDQVLEMRSAEYGVFAYIKPDAFPSVGTKQLVTVQEIAESGK